MFELDASVQPANQKHVLMALPAVKSLVQDARVHLPNNLTPDPLVRVLILPFLSIQDISSVIPLSPINLHFNKDPSILPIGVIWMCANNQERPTNTYWHIGKEVFVFDWNNRS
jgi:hypothetical protein